MKLFKKGKKEEDEILEHEEEFDDFDELEEERPKLKVKKSNKHSEHNSRKKNFVISMVLLLGLIIFLFIFKPSNSSNIISPVNNNNQNINSQDNTSYLTQSNNDNMNFYKKLEYAKTINVDSCEVWMLDNYLLYGKIIMDVPSYTYSIEMYALTGEELNITTDIDLYTNKLNIMFTPSSIVETPFVILFVDGVNSVEYYICRNPQINKYNLNIDLSSTKIEKIENNYIVLNVSYNVDEQSIKLYPTFKEILKHKLANEISAGLYAYKKSDNGLYALKEITKYGVTDITYHGDIASIKLKLLDSYYERDPDGIYILKVKTATSELTRVVKIGTMGNIVTAFPIEKTSNSIKFELLNPYNLKVKMIKVVVLYDNSTSITKTIDESDISQYSIIDFTVGDVDTNNISKITLIITVTTSDGKSKVAIKTFNFS